LILLPISGVQAGYHLVDPQKLPEGFCVNVEPIDDEVHFEIFTPMHTGLLARARVLIRDDTGYPFFGDISPRESTRSKSVYQFVTNVENVVRSTFELELTSVPDGNEPGQLKDTYTFNLRSFVREYYATEYPDIPQNVSENTRFPEILTGYNRVMVILDRPHFRLMAPPSRKISFDQYQEIKASYIAKNEYWWFGLLLGSRDTEGSRWRRMELEAFDDKKVWVSEVIRDVSRKRHGWDWIARYRLDRNAQIDKKLHIARVVEERAKVIGGVKYGMTSEEVVALKGQPLKIIEDPVGNAELRYDDVSVYIRMWVPPMERFPARGKVLHVEPPREEMRNRSQDESTAPSHQ